MHIYCLECIYVYIGVKQIGWTNQTGKKLCLVIRKLLSIMQASRYVSCLSTSATVTFLRG